MSANPPTPDTHRTAFVQGLLSVLHLVGDNHAVVLPLLASLGVGPAGPAVGLIVKYGVTGLAAGIEAVTTPTFTEAEVAANLAAKGFRVTPIDLVGFYGAP